MTTSVRPAMVDDIVLMQEVEVDAGQRFRSLGFDWIADDDPPTEAALRGHIDQRAAWVATEVDGTVVGYAVGSLVDGDGHLDQVSVIQSASGRGIGRMLVEEVGRWAAAQGAGALTLTTFGEVPWNGPYYERLGFVVVTDEECGAELRSIRSRERSLGLDVSPRVAMRKALEHRAG